MFSTCLSLLYIYSVAANAKHFEKHIKNVDSFKTSIPLASASQMAWITDGVMIYFYPVHPDNVTYYLYSRAHKESGTAITKDTLKHVRLDKTLQTKIISHGWMGNYKKPPAQRLKDAYLKYHKYNVILIDWYQICGSWNYMAAARLVSAVGVIVADMVNALIQFGIKSSNIHLIGFSLGAHLVTAAGNHCKVNRVTALDPAGPCLNDDTKFATSSEFVDVIHTSQMGKFGKLGTIDFYPNGGKVQPDCNDDDSTTMSMEKISCYHNYSWLIFSETIENGTKFPARECTRHKDPIEENCKGQIQHMGYRVSRKARGIYYAATRGLNVNYDDEEED